MIAIAPSDARRFLAEEIRVTANIAFDLEKDRAE